MVNGELIKQAKDALKSIISENMFNELEITDENIFEKVGITNYYRIEKIYKFMEETEETNQYFVEGKSINKISLEKEDFNLIFTLDKENGTFSVIPEIYLKENEIKNLEDFKLDKENTIVNNGRNTYSTKVTDEKICNTYFSDLKNNITYDIEYTYSLLSDEYKEIRFKTIDEFKAFINRDFSNKNDRTINRYNVVDEENTRYVIVDQYGNTYIIEEKEPFDYTVKMDTYSIDLPEFTTNYTSAENERKVTLNIGKIIDAINYADYRYVYKKLNKEYHSNNFSNINEFIEFAKNKFFDRNKIKEFQCKKEENSYVCYLKLANKENEEEEKTVILLMNLLEGTEFEILFSD